jgi:hypothetical protein
MLELLGILGIVVVGGLVLGVVALVAGLLKILLKVALIPVWLGVTAVKGLVWILVGGIGLLILGPVVLGVGLVVLIPLLILGGLVWAGVTLASTI